MKVDQIYLDGGNLRELYSLVDDPS
uniref:Uncharacterized protein n=1 Tax=Moniliophthora roreri TaxID=221103 RepID=A0A0W0GC43_MONRR